ncbi:MAG TPA: RluA family pseudouridine synthase [Spirochaetota bacterium]|nr:RluA family pseudouridine synthase [Spirochaetota bacterium]HPI91061.1 RluA family pseudouridine synthase [Spirochaetota bacterium]HPR49968.1 RluA family pseudouridine synthase [Spirochaetota bacterium]
MSTRYETTVPGENNLERIDKFLVISLEADFSRSFIQKLIKDGNILANGSPIRQNYKVKTDDVILIEVPEPEVLDLVPRDIPLDIVYEDDDIAVINKKPGMVVHPGPGNYDHTMVNALLFHLKGLSSIGGVERPGIVHRLDKDTSGLIVVAKNDRAHQHLVNEFSARRVKKKYKAVVTGKPADDHGLIDMPIARHRKYRHKMAVVESGRDAVTEYRLEKMWNNRLGIFSLLDITLHTGRTHQIRVHLSASGLPIVGDPIYSKKWEKHRVPYLLLASVFLSFEHPRTGDEVSFEVSLPDHMRDFLEKLDSFNSI